MNLDLAFARRLDDVMRRCDPDALQPGEEQTTDAEWDAAREELQRRLGAERPHG